MMRHIILLRSLFLSIGCALLLCAQTVHAGQVTLRPSGDPASPNWQTYPTNGLARWSIINRTNLGTSPWICAASGNVSDLYDLTNASVGQGATAVTVQAYTFMGSGALLANAYITLNADIGGTLVGTTSTQNPPSTIGLLNNCTSTGGTYEWRSATYNGTWTQADIDNLKASVGRQNNLLNGPIRVSQVEAVITYTDPPTVSQSAYRLYQNANSTSPGSPLAATNTVADVSSSSAFRVRLGATASGSNWGANYSSHTLQYAAKNQSTCAASTGWADVQSGSGVIRWYDNASVTSGATIASYAQDPTVTGSKVYQTYQEANTFANPNAVTTGNTGLWDFSLQTVSGTPGTSYCLRMLNSPGDFTDTYTQYPEFTLTGSLDISIVDNSGVTVSSPSVSFGSLPTQWSCQSSAAILGSASQKMRITNNLSSSGWTTSIAATNGSHTLWQSAASHYYDYNDASGSPAGCSAGLDSDIYAGQLGVSPSIGSSSPQSGCTNTGITLGSTAYFSEGITDAIGLASGSSSASRFCYWDITGIGLTQRVPAAQPNGSYYLDLTITVATQ
jgi:hypothetical protein